MRPGTHRLALILLAGALAVAGCRRPPAPTAVPSLAPVSGPTATASPPPPTAAPAPTATAMPIATLAATAAPTLRPGPTAIPDLRTYAAPDRLWSLDYPEALLRPEPLGDRIVLFISADRSTFVAVDSYLAAGDEYGNTGEGLRNRARDALAQVYGQAVRETGVLTGPDIESSTFYTGISFTTAAGSKGEAVYAQPDRYERNYRVYGVLLGYKAGAEAALQPLLRVVRSSFRQLAILPLQVPWGGEPLWAVYSVGLRSFDLQLDEGHFVAIYARRGGAWQELQRLALPQADYVNSSAVKQVPLEPSRIWLEVQSGLGAHSGGYDLLSEDGQALRLELSHFSSSPGAGQVADLLGDGQLEVVLNASEPYVFCYACGVRYVAHLVMRWDGSRLAPVQLAPLGEGAPAELRQLTNRAVALAQAGLYKEAQALMAQAAALNPQDPTFAWDAALIRLTGDARAEQARRGPYPLLDHLFYGDYPAALNTMRPFTPAQLFGERSPLIVGTPAESWESALSEWITTTTTAALGAEPDLAAAYFLRGWAVYRASPGSPAALADIQRASQLDPAEPLYAQSVAYLKRTE